MPNSLYVAGREPPTRLDQFLKHGSILSMGFTSFLTGILLVLSLHREIVVSRALDGLNGWSLLLLALVMFCGFGLLVSGALLPRGSWSDIDVLKPLTVGSLALCLAWFAFGISVFFSGNAYAMITITLASGFAWSLGFNGVALGVSWWRLEQRKKLEKLQEGPH